MAIFDLLFTFFSYQGKDKKILQYISHLHTYTYFAHPIDFFFFFFFAFLRKLWFYHVWFLFGVTPGMDSFWAILEQLINNKMVSNI